MKNEFSTDRLKVLQNVTNPFVLQVLKIIDKNLQEETFNVIMLSSKMFIDRSQLFRKLKQGGYPSPSEMILLKRMEYALVDIEKTTLSINEISKRYGFKSQSYFTKAFKRIFHITPLSHRKLQHSS